jgi:CrcB protein
MNPVLEGILIAIFGGLGAATRLVVDGLVRRRIRTTVPAGTMIINVSGSLLLGLVVGLTGAQLLSEPWHQVLGVGFLGGYTTFSTASFETVRLLQHRQYAAALVNGVGMLLAAVTAAALGLLVGANL